MAQSIFQNGAAPATPASGYVSVYTKTDKTLAYKDDTGAETVLTAGANTATTKLPSITATQGSGALTVSAASLYLDFRSTTLTSGAISTILAAPANYVIPSGATHGFVSGVQGKLVVIEMNNAGTAEIASINISGGNDLSETGLISTTAISASSTAANVFYSTTARTNLAYRVVCSIDAVNTAGAWGNPVLVQGAGGQANFKSASMIIVNTANGYGSTNTMIRRFTNVVINQGSDITYADSATLGASFTINSNGIYAINFSESFNAPSTGGISLNSSQLTTTIQTINIVDRLSYGLTALANYPTSIAWTGYLKYGSIIRAHCDGGVAGSFPNTFTITRVS